MEIRLAQINDLPNIMGIMNEAILNTTALYDYAPRTLDMVTDWYHQKVKDNFPLYVGEVAGQVIGFVTYGSFRARAAYQFTIEHSVYVDEPYRGKGYGKTLLQFIISIARANKYHALIGGIDAENTLSIALHEQFGFTEVGRLPQVGYKFDRWLDLVFMQLII